METELERRVREALATPPREKLNRRRQLAQQRSVPRVQSAESSIHSVARDADVAGVATCSLHPTRRSVNDDMLQTVRSKSVQCL